MREIFGQKLKSPLLWLIILMTGFSIWKTSSLNNLQSLVRSDGRGYYAYLPALFIYGDKTYEKSLKAEASYHNSEYNQEYLYRTSNGKIYNKYFPGKAVGDLPFFLLACITALIFQLPVDGYSDVFMIFQFFSSLFYGICGLILFSRVCRQLFPAQRNSWLVTLLILSGPAIFYCFLSSYYTHHLSFFLFSAAAFLFLKFKESKKASSLILLGLTFGVIFLVRPTNVIFLLFLPLLLKDKTELLTLISDLFKNRVRALSFSLIAFFSCIMLLMLLWKWQTGSYVVWSYNGEGFDFLHANWWSVLFSFRIGMFLHIPALILIVAIVILSLRKNRYFIGWWTAYFVSLIWIIATWWCWDFESPFSVRPLSEHFLFLAFPLFFAGIRFRKLIIGSLVVTALIGIVRVSQFETGYLVNQRFTKSNYLSSLVFWKKDNFERWNFNLSCHPFGRVIDRQLVFEKTEETKIDNSNEFALTGSIQLKPVNRKGLMYYTVTLEKQFFGEKMEDVFLVVDAGSKKSAKRYYASVNLYADKFEGKNGWIPLRFEGTIPDYFNDYDAVTIYLWNKGKQKLAVKNYRAVVETYGK